MKKIEEIDELVDIEEFKGKIEVAREAYDKLTEVQKGLVLNYIVLTDAEEKYKTSVNPSAVQEIKVERSESWYEMSGRKLAGKPTRNGVYVHNGKLEMVK